jgi:hypothetical protein
VDIAALVRRQAGMGFRKLAESIDPVALDLVKRLLDPSPNARMKPSDILGHEWITGVKELTWSEWFSSIIALK